ncbi:stalk domain-containing protein [Paenibacillus sp. S-38]|uniref:stalk domain-containing protein n=1 Tax=Paenibacillus sp. S-38 TaxID=3416710 RepID=UPI003CE7EA12
MPWFRPILVMTLLFAVLFSMTPAFASAEQPKSPKVFVDTEQIPFEVDPLIVSGTTLVQFRPLFEAMGMEVKWEEASRTVTGSKSDLTISLRIEDPQAVVNGRQVQLSEPARIVGGSTMVPLRFIGEATGALVHWDAVNSEITIVTPALLESLGMSKEEMQKKLDEYAAKQDQPPSASSDGETAAAPPAEVPKPEIPAAPQTPTAGPSKPVDLAALQGMYYGFRDDFGGYECGGACWDIYTFLPDKRVLVGVPPQGGPETIDCTRDGCTTYTIADGKMTLGSGESFKIALKDGYLTIQDVTLFPVAAAAEGLKLEGTYKNIGYQGLVGIHAFSSSWTEYLTFRSDGTFESTDLSLSSLDVQVSTTNAAGSKSDSGTYQISGNTLVLTYQDGTVLRRLFFDHDDDGTKVLKDIQIGSKNFYIPDEQ